MHQLSRPGALPYSLMISGGSPLGALIQERISSRVMNEAAASKGASGPFTGQDAQRPGKWALNSGAPLLRPFVLRTLEPGKELVPRND